MYWTLILILQSLLFAVSTVSAEEVSAPVCSVGAVPAGGCAAADPFYAYSSEFNGRIDSGSDLTAADNSISLALPWGYYSSKKITWVSSNLDPANIKEGIQVLGVTGALREMPYPACTAANPTTEVCELPAGKFVYSSAYGGRATSCTVNATTPKSFTGPCWLTDPQNSTIRTTPTMNNCSAEGLLSLACMVQKNQYWYTQSYGGRGTDCVEGVNSASCWIPVTTASVSVGNSCNEDLTNNGLNVTACKTAGTNRYVYTQKNGGRGTNCLNDLSGYCYIDGVSKSSVAATLVAGNIRNKDDKNNPISFFGIAGTYTGTEMVWGTGAHKNKGSLRRSYKDEAAINPATPLYSTYPAYHPIPKLSQDSDAYNKSAQVTKVDRTGWGITQCGTAGAIPDRITDCATLIGAGATWAGTTAGNAGQGIWQLVTRTYVGGKNYEVWKDTQTGLLWSSLVHSHTNWCRASGASNSQNVSAEARSDDISNMCNNSTYQSTGVTDALSACYEGSGFNGSFTGSVQDGKGGLLFSNAPEQGRVKWRLPSMYDYILANHHGIRFVLPDIGADVEEWTSTIYSGDPSMAWIFHGSVGIRQIRSRIAAFAVRCVGR